MRFGLSSWCFPAGPPDNSIPSNVCQRKRSLLCMCAQLITIPCSHARECVFMKMKAWKTSEPASEHRGELLFAHVLTSIFNNLGDL